MSQVYFISDLHIAHKSILNFAGRCRGGNTIEEHDDWVIAQCNSVLNKNDVLWLLGDIAFSREGLTRLDEIKCQKKIILGNHDRLPLEEYMKYGRIYPGLTRYKQHWLSHAPIHPQELYGMPNIHGHVHTKNVPDEMYINVSIEMYKRPVTLEQIYAHREENDFKACEGWPKEVNDDEESDDE